MEWFIWLTFYLFGIKEKVIDIAEIKIVDYGFMLLLFYRVTGVISPANHYPLGFILFTKFSHRRVNFVNGKFFGLIFIPFKNIRSLLQHDIRLWFKYFGSFQ